MNGPTKTEPTAERVVTLQSILDDVMSHVKKHDERFHGGFVCMSERVHVAALIVRRLNLTAAEVAEEMAMQECRQRGQEQQKVETEGSTINVATAPPAKK